MWPKLKYPSYSVFTYLQQTICSGQTVTAGLISTDRQNEAPAKLIFSIFLKCASASRSDGRFGLVWINIIFARNTFKIAYEKQNK